MARGYEATKGGEMKDWRDKFEEPAECLDCGLKCEATDLTECALSSDVFCPACNSGNIKAHRPKEDKERR